MGSAVVADTFLRFKGLERPAVIVTDLGWRGSSTPGFAMHIALSGPCRGRASWRPGT